MPKESYLHNYFNAACRLSRTWPWLASPQRLHLESCLHTYLELDLGLGNVLLAAVSAGNLLSLRDLVPDGLSTHQHMPLSIPNSASYLGGEVLQGVALDGVDAELGAGLDNGESARQEKLLVAAALLDNLNKAGLQLLDRRDVVGQDTHLAGFRGNVDLDAASEMASVLVLEGGAGSVRASGRRTLPAT